MWEANQRKEMDSASEPMWEEGRTRATGSDKTDDYVVKPSLCSTARSFQKALIRSTQTSHAICFSSLFDRIKERYLYQKSNIDLLNAADEENEKLSSASVISSALLPFFSLND